MGEAGEEREKVSGMVKGISRDLLLLQRFSNERSDFLRKREREEESNNNVEGEVVEEEGPELSLGLSMNGKFGVDPKKSNKRVKKTFEFDKMRRSSSVSFFVPAVAASEEKNQARVFPNVTYAPLTRTCSLPADTRVEKNEEKEEEEEEELKKRKELQSLRRLEAKKRRLEKLKFSRAGKDYRVDSEENSCEENGSNIIDSVGPDSITSYANGNSNGIPSSQGSIGSQGSGSSGLSEFDSQPTQTQVKVKQNNEGVVKTPSKMMFYQALQSRQKNSKSIPLPLPLPTKESAIFGSGGAAAVKGEKVEEETNCRVNNVMLDMPCVSTIGNGPNGRKVDGFLYRYRRGEEVSIVCVCHGSFFTPAEFVKHAGGNDVEHPLKHIVVNSSPLF